MTRFDPAGIPLTGTHLIEASAGTGKTYAITGLVIRLLLERGVPVDRILVVTYTRAATAELRDRVRNRVQKGLAALKRGGDPEDSLLDHLARRSVQAGTVPQNQQRLTAALRDFDQAAIHTIHAFCRRMLSESAFESGLPFTTGFLENPSLLVREIAGDFWANGMMEAPEALVRYLTQRKKSPRVTPQTFETLATKAVDHKEMPVLPEHGVEADPGAAADWRAAHAHAAALWSAEKEQITDLICLSKALNRNKYRLTSLRDVWIPQMEALMSSAVALSPATFEKLSKFTPAQLKQGCKKGHTPPAHPFFAACEVLLQADQRWLANLKAQETALYLDLIHYARREMAGRKQRDGTRTFDDLLFLMRDAVRSPRGGRLKSFLRERFAAVLIDEFQDTDPVQYQLFHQVYHEASGETNQALFLIGDPKQAIYAFRGADIFTYMEARSQAGEHLYALDTNWRSDAKLIHALNTLYQRTPRPFLMQEMAYAPVQAAPPGGERCGEKNAAGPPLRVLLVGRDPRQGTEKWLTAGWADAHLPQGIAGDIVRLRTAGRLPCGSAVRSGEIAILCRVNRQLRLMQKALRAAGIPSVQEGEASVFDSPEAAEVQRVLAGVAAPGNARAMRAALATTLLGVSGDELATLQREETGWSRWVERFREWQQLWRQKGFIQAYRRILDETCVSRRFLSLPGGDRWLTDLFHLGELLQAEATDRQAGPHELLRWLRVMRLDPLARIAGPAAEATQIRLESDLDAVKLVTIHKSKGLEYDAVYCPYLWEGTRLFRGEERWPHFHDAGDHNRLKMDVGSVDHASHVNQATREAQEERARLTYVALTRARHFCTVVWGAFRGAEKSPLDGLLMQPPKLGGGIHPSDVARAPVHELSDKDIQAELELLAAEAAGAIGVEAFHAERPQGLESPAATDEKRHLEARTWRRRLASCWRISSFSGLTARQDEEAEPGLPDRDHDREDNATAEPDTHLQPVRREHPVLLDGFPRGSRAGQMMHAILENIDFRVQDEAALAPAVEAALGRYGFPLHLRDRLALALAAVFKTPLQAGDARLSLGVLAPEQRLNELEFTYPVAEGGGLLTPAGLADLLRSESAPPWPPSYPHRVERSGFLPLEGFLRGFADLVFTHRDRWYLVDYKSNHLGSDASDYAPERLPVVMAQHHYFLQYHIYLVALHRYLSLRIKAYDPARHLGGVYYLFLRGMSPEHPPGCGVFHHCPAPQTVERLSRLMQGGSSQEAPA